MSRELLPDLECLEGELAEKQGPLLWRSLEELADTPEVRRYLEAEFPDVMQVASVDRRTLLRLMSASLALGGLAACNNGRFGAPLLSQGQDSPGYTPGVPLVIATSLELNGYGRGVLVRTQEGRPIKVEGNTLHPASLGATDVFAQAEILSLYDPDRSATPLQKERARTWDEFIDFIRPIRSELVVSEGRGLSILMPPTSSPTVNRLISQSRALFPHARWHSFAPIDDDNRRLGARIIFGRNVDMIYDLSQVDMVVTLGGDLFSEEAGSVRYAADYQARRRDGNRPLPRLVAVECRPSLIGTRADERVILRPRDLEKFALDLAGALGASGSASSDGHPEVSRLEGGLRRAGARSLVVAGREQPPHVHALAFAINASLGAFGTTIRAIEPVIVPEEGGLSDLAKDIAAERVSQLLILGGNPAYSAPADLEFTSLVRRVPLSLHLGSHRDETAFACHWHLPERHIFESWGDLRAFDGTAGVCQPATIPLKPGLSAGEFLGVMAGQSMEGRALVEATWRQALQDDFEVQWSAVLENGVVEQSGAPPVEANVQRGWDARLPSPNAGGPIEVVFAPDPSLWDGRYANNGWLQELPRPLSKQTWGNAALISPETASAYGLVSGDVIDLNVDGQMLRAPVWVQPGQAPDTLTLPLGYGRSQAGRVGSNIGFNAFTLRTTKKPWIADATITSAGGKVSLVTTQNHHALQGRDIVRVESPVRQEAGEKKNLPSLYPDWPSDGYAWGMAIDLDACIGCNACVIACQAENNIPIVGPEEVARGREMHWLRVDRYYAGDPAAPSTYFQPVPCMQCEKAPCEVACPVNATVHSSEGLNDMVYNRCIGTRTCSNNCPYKVRRFNFFDYQSGDYAASQEAMNPQVTVREHGVMEKCTYCVHRIGTARADARVEDRGLQDGEVATACQQACPTQAIVFGNINDPDSAVSRLKRNPRNYALLGMLNTRPRTTYLARIEAQEEE